MVSIQKSLAIGLGLTAQTAECIQIKSIIPIHDVKAEAFQRVDNEEEVSFLQNKWFLSYFRGTKEKQEQEKRQEEPSELTDLIEKTKALKKLQDEAENKVLDLQKEVSLSKEDLVSIKNSLSPNELLLRNKELLRKLKVLKTKKQEILSQTQRAQRLKKLIESMEKTISILRKKKA